MCKCWVNASIKSKHTPSSSNKCVINFLYFESRIPERSMFILSMVSPSALFFTLHLNFYLITPLKLFCKILLNTITKSSENFKCLFYLTCLLYLSPLVTFLTLSFSRLSWHRLSLSALLTLLSLCPYSQCGITFCLPPLLSAKQSHLMQRCLCLILLEPQDYMYLTTYYKSILHPGIPSSLCCQVGCLSFPVLDIMLPDSPGKPGSPQGCPLLLYSSVFSWCQ